MRRLALSALELSPRAEGVSAGETLRRSIDLARFVETLGLTRFWLAEHHNAGSLASACPEILIGHVAAATETLRVGAGGIMLPNHSPLKVAEAFRLHEAMFPGRIDLALGRAPGTDPRTARVLRRHQHIPVEQFEQELDQLERFLEHDGQARTAFPTDIVAIPTVDTSPRMFMLSSSGGGASLAAARGRPLAFAHHMNPHEAAAITQAYRRDFVAGRGEPEPYAIVSVGCVCAETDELARDLATSAVLQFVRFSQGNRDAPLVPAETAKAYPYSPEERAIRKMMSQGAIVGSPARVAEALRRVQAETGCDEIMLLTLMYDHEARKKSYELVARELDIIPR